MKTTLLRCAAGGAASATLLATAAGASAAPVLSTPLVGKGNVCGYTKAKFVLIPKKSAVGDYVFYANAGPKLNKKTAISQSYQVQRF